MAGLGKKTLKLLEVVYPASKARETYSSLVEIVEDFKNKYGEHECFTLNQKDIALITYASTFSKTKQSSLQTLLKFIYDNHLENNINTVHILPFYPWDTDRGFSIKDYYAVDERYGTWADIKNLSQSVNLMFDFVANHASIENPIVQSALIANHLESSHPKYKFYSKYKDFVIVFSDDDKPSDESLKNLARPRPNPVLTHYFVTNENNKLSAFLGYSGNIKNVIGSGWVWTTFSRPVIKGQETTKQVDLDYKNPDVLIEAIKILLFYIISGAQLIRLDAIGYVWKKLDSTSLHEKEAHTILEIIHDVMSVAAKSVVTIAEVNEPQDKVIGYLGKGNHVESDLVYQFTHFPLAIYAVLTGDGKPYVKWLKTTKIFEGRQFTTVLGSHDGLGLKPAKGFLNEKQLSRLCNILVDDHKALPNYAHLPGGKKIIYEICATPWNLINSSDTKADFDTQLAKYLVVLALGLSIKGIPAIYVNGLFGAKNYIPKGGLDENRTINRQSFNFDEIQKTLSNKSSNYSRIMNAVYKLLETRKEEGAFTPEGSTHIVNTHNDHIIAYQLTGYKPKDKITCITNVSGKTQKIKIKHIKPVFPRKPIDLIGEDIYKPSDPYLTLTPYQIVWLKDIS